MKTHMDVFDINDQKHLDKVAVSELDKKYDEWRARGYTVVIDRSGDVCIDDEDDYDDGKYYTEQIKELKS